MKSDDKHTLPISLLLFCTLYWLAVFPWAFFRHDDWLILGNAVLHLPRDWGFAWRTSLFFDGVEGPWFFRPFFKLGTYVFFRVFHFHYWLWLAALSACVAGALALAHATLRRLGGAASLFVVLFVASLHLHFASLVWMGEGMMNNPQLLLLALSTYAFVRGLTDDGAGWGLLSAGAFLLSLGFKESSLFLPLFLAALVITEKPLRGVPLRRRSRALLPHAAIAGAYTLWRFGFTELNGSYRPFEPSHAPDFWTGPAVKLLAALLVPLALWLALLAIGDRAAARRSLKKLSAKWPYLPFLGLLIAPYLGHPFFSPGWLLLPGFFFLMVACLVAEPLAEQTCWQWRVGVAVGLVTAVPVAWQAHELGWWQWQGAQRTVLTQLRDADPRTTRAVHIVDCDSERYPQATFTRVVGFRDGLTDLWEILHGNRIPIVQVGCLPESRTPASGDGVVVWRWHFPRLERQ